MSFDNNFDGDAPSIDRHYLESLSRKLRLLHLQRKAMDHGNDSDSSDAGSRTRNGARKATKITSTDLENNALAKALLDQNSQIPGQPAPSKPVELVKLDPAEVGMSTGLKKLYSGKEDKRGRFQWQTTEPEDLGVPAEDAESEKFAIIVRHVKAYHDPKKVLSMHSIVVQSPLLKDLLKDVLVNYPGIAVDLRRLEFSGRFEPLIHRWTELKTAIEKLKQSRDEDVANVQGENNGLVDEEIPVRSVGDQHDEDVITNDNKTSQEANNEAATPSVNGDAMPESGEKQPGSPAIDVSIDKRIEHAELFYNLLVSEFTETIEQSTDMKEKGVMTYDLLWTLFQPGSLVYSKQQGQDRVLRLSSARYGVDHNGNEVFWLSCQYVDYDGTSFGTNKLNMSIGKYEGSKSITSLPTLPWDFHGHKDEIYAKLVERGGKIEALAGSHYRSYHGIGWRMGHSGQKEKYVIKGRIVLDTQGWNRFNPNMAVYVTPLHRKTTAARHGSSHSSHLGHLSHGHPISIIYPPMGSQSAEEDYDDGYDLQDGGMPVDGFFEEETNEDPTKEPLTDEQKLLCSPLVRGYALKEKLWLNLFVNAVQDITFNERAFDSLVLPKNQKELILGFTSTQQGYRSQFDDVIEGKGRGIILLLCGPPGVGKTLTAESIAEEMRVPLWMMSAGDLGLDPRSVERKLQGILDMCTRWNAILLLDEADVFLEERSLHELERNKLVTIFLRVLEYYEGIMFLTTNRVNTFDAAFQSRIHISLEYKELDIKSRKAVWQNFLRQHDVVQAAARERPPKPLATAAKSNGAARARSSNLRRQSSVGEVADADEEAKAQHLKYTLPHVITDSDINKLAALSMNGRQIKNILKTAQLLASQRGEGLSFKHVDTVMDVTQHLHNSNRESRATKSSLFS